MRFCDLLYRSLNLFPDKSKSLDIQLLIETAFELSRTEFWIKKNDPITDQKGLKRFYRLRSQLAANTPMAYILGEKEFYGERFLVNKQVLIPRPETEILLEQALNLIKRPLHILDIGTGSGILGILLAKKTGSQVTALDINRKVLPILKKNICAHHVESLVFPVIGDLFPPPGQVFDMIVSNPPYIPEYEWQELAQTVRDFEPRVALVAAENGLAIIGRIAQEARQYLRPGGSLLLEMGYNQKEAVLTLLNALGYVNPLAINDYSNIPRVLVAGWDGLTKE